MQQTAFDEAQLVELAQSGDRAAFAELYDAYFERIYDFAYQLTRSAADAADVTSDTFLKAMERLDRLREPGAFRGWLYAIARNAAMDVHGRRGRLTELPAQAEAIPGAPDASAPVEDDELRRLVWEAATTLNPRDYSIFEMTVRQGLDSSEVGEALGVKPSHAYVLVNRLKASVEDALAAVVLARAGRRDCTDLDAIVERFGDTRSPAMRKAVVRHLRSCDDCKASRAKYATAAALLGGVAHASPADGLKGEIARRINTAWTTRPPGGSGASRRSALGRVGALVVVVAALVVLSLAQRATPETLGLALGTPPPPSAAPAKTTKASPGSSPASTATPTASPASPQPTAVPASPAAPPARAPSVALSVGSATLWDGPCGPRTTALTARVDAPAGVRSVVFTIEHGSTRLSSSGQGGPATYRGQAGPFSTAGIARVWAEASDGGGRAARSSTQTIAVRACGTGEQTPLPTFPPFPTGQPQRTQQPTAPPKTQPPATPCTDPELCPRPPR